MVSERVYSHSNSTHNIANINIATGITVNNSCILAIATLSHVCYIKHTTCSLETNIATVRAQKQSIILLIIKIPLPYYSSFNALLMHTSGNELLSKMNVIFLLNTSEMTETFSLSYTQVQKTFSYEECIMEQIERTYNIIQCTPSYSYMVARRW